ncbi:MAG TPA: PAS domain S-box protein [Ignavibacteriales bacterium]|nr:PAS domain S-box protein [Ignavibacteriales bacterium]
MSLFFNKPKNKLLPEPVLNSEYYEIIFRDNHFIMLVINPATLEIVDANNRACRFYGYSIEELKKLKVSDINVMPEEEIFSRMRETRSGRKNDFRFKHRLANGQIRDVQVNSGSIRLKNEELLFTIVHDITGKLESEQKMKQLQKVVESSGEVILITDNQGTITFINPAFTRLYGYEAGEVVGKTTPLILSSGQSQNSAVELFDNKIKSREIFQAEFVNKTKSGTLVNVEVTVNPILSDTGDYYGYIAIQRNITDRIKQETVLKKAKEKAEELSSIKSTLLSNMNHEFRTPLMGILGLSDIMRTEKDVSKANELAEGIYMSGKRLLSTLTSVLSLSQLSDPEFKAELKPLNLNSLLKELAEEWRAGAERKGLVILNEIPGFSIMASSDEAMLKQAVNNLLDNAVKFTARGTVKVELALRRESEGSRAVISVSDTGIGISREDLDLIFSEFRQVSSGYSRRFEGCGLGLTLAKRIIEKLGGKIEIKSEVDKGSDFSLLLPLAEMPVQEEGAMRADNKKLRQAKMAEYLPEPGLPLPEILFVEDNTLNAMAARIYLREFFRMDHAKDGVSALDMVMAKNYSLILMDINLGAGLNGIEVMKEVRKNENYQRVPIIAVTGYAASEDVQFLLGEGFDDCLLKPFDEAEIKEIISEAFRKIPAS